jgi:hypothetical protein
MDVIVSRYNDLTLKNAAQGTRLEVSCRPPHGSSTFSRRNDRPHPSTPALSFEREKSASAAQSSKSAGFDLGIFIAGRYLPGNIVPGQSILVLLAWGFWGPG